MRAADVAAVAAAIIVAVVAVSGGAFEPSQRLLAGAGMALLATVLPICLRRVPEAGEWLVLAAVVWSAVSAASVAGYPLAAREMVGGWLVAWLVWVAVRRAGRATRRLLGFVAAAACVPVALAIVVECTAAGQLRMGGLFVNPNVAAALLVPGVAAVWYLRRPAPASIWLWPVLCATIVGVVLSGSRAGLLALVVMAAVMLPRGRVRWLGVGAASAAAAGFVISRFVQSPDALAWHRLEIWRALWPLVVDHPLLGVGPGWLEDATGIVRIAHEGSIARWSHIIGSAESTPYGWLIRTGLVGSGLLAAGWALVWRRDRPEPTGGAAVVAGIGVLALFHDYLMVDVVLWWWALLVGAVWPIAASADGDAHPTTGPRVARIVIGVAVGLVVLWTVAAPAHARRFWWRAPSTPELAVRTLHAEPWFAEPARWLAGDVLERDAWAWGDAAEALAWSRRMVSLHPGSSAVWSEYGRVHARVVTELGPWPDAVDGARRGFRRATELEPHLPWPWLQWAQLERSLGRANEARDLAERSVAEEPHFVRGHLFLARLAVDAHDQDTARELFRRARTATNLGRGRQLSDYEIDLLRAPAWQVEDIARALAPGDDPGSATLADAVQ